MKRLSPVYHDLWPRQIGWFSRPRESPAGDFDGRLSGSWSKCVFFLGSLLYEHLFQDNYVLGSRLKRSLILHGQTCTAAGVLCLMPCVCVWYITVDIVLTYVYSVNISKEFLLIILIPI